MTPTRDDVQVAAYGRWERRGRRHGFDRADWIAAERERRFARNYRVVVADRLDAEAPRAIGDPSRRRCRFCGQAAPRTSFADGGVPVFPGFLGPGSPVAYDQCDDCRDLFAEGIGPALAEFAGPLADAESPRAAGIAVDAFKGLIQLAMSLMPARDVADYEDAIEWISNPDHDLDLNVFRGFSCAVHVTAAPSPSSWATLASRAVDDEPMPSSLFFLGCGHVVLQVPVPLGTPDDEHDATDALPPDVLPPSPFGPEYDPVARVLLPLVASRRALATA